MRQQRFPQRDPTHRRLRRLVEGRGRRVPLRLSRLPLRPLHRLREGLALTIAAQSTPEVLPGAQRTTSSAGFSYLSSRF